MLSRVFVTIRCAAAALLMIAGFGMINAVKDIDNPSGAPLVFAFYGFVLFVVGAVLALREVARHEG